MNTRLRKNQWVWLLSGLLALSSESLADGGHISQHPAATEPTRSDERSWAFSFENDILAGGSRDKDYTYGLNVSYVGPEVADLTFSPRPVHAWLDNALRLRDLGRPRRHSLELGVYGFTPDDIEKAAPIPDDRPYASLVYYATTREQLDRVNNVSWQSSLTLGALGLDLVGSGQNTVHDWLGNTEAQGWHNQISDGGEPTARYSLARQKLLTPDSDFVEVKSTFQGSVGYLTEASYALSFRAGDIHSSWWRFDPEITNYGEKSAPNAPGVAVAEHYLWGGVAIKARAYNAFLQGQFRSSAVSLEADEIRHALVEAWLGYSISFTNGLRASYVLRGHTSEIRSGRGDRSLLWGGLILAKSF